MWWQSASYVCMPPIQAKWKGKVVRTTCRLQMLYYLFANVISKWPRIVFACGCAHSDKLNHCWSVSSIAVCSIVSPRSAVVHSEIKLQRIKDNYSELHIFDTYICSDKQRDFFTAWLSRGNWRTERANMPIPLPSVSVLDTYISIMYGLFRFPCSEERANWEYRRAATSTATAFTCQVPKWWCGANNVW